ncbi:hypothetical protein K2X85_09275 [bacterium]|nr:hypothetical protein [bacterium]
MKFRTLVVLAMFILAGSSQLALSTVREFLSEDVAFVSLLDTWPLAVGTWSGEKTEVDEALIKTSPEVSTRSFVFRQGDSEQRIWVAVSIGPPGLVTEDLPEKTYRFVGFAYDNESKQVEPIRKSLRVDLEGECAKMNFWARDSAAPLRVWHGWFDGQRWHRPELARWQFLDKPALARLQIWYPMTRDPLASPQEPWVDNGQEFVRQVLPTLSARLAPLDQSWSGILAQKWND